MNRTLKRVLGLAGSVAIGVVGAVTFASAAQAHHSDVTGTPECLPDGNWQVTWTVQEGDWHGKDPNLGAWITKVKSSSDAEITGDFSLNTTGDDQVALPDLEQGETPLQATQVIGADVDEVWLKVSSEWSNHNTDPGKKIHVKKPNTDCAPQEEPKPEPTASAVSDCLGLTVTVGNNNDELAELTMTPSTGEPVTVTPAVNEPVSEFFAVEDPEAGLTVTVTHGDVEVGVFTWNPEGLNCEWGVVYDTCEGLEFELAVPESAPETTVTLTPSEGDEVVVVLTPGAEAEVVTFTATGDELTVSYVIDDGKSKYTGEVPWTKPEECEEVPPTEAPTTPAAQLPTTGSSMTIMISAAAALVVAAAVLFFIARRRRAAADW